MNGKMKKAVVAYLIFMAFIAVAYASYWVYSNTVEVTVTEYSLTLAPAAQNVTRYQNATFTATLKLGGNPVQNATIRLMEGNATVAQNVTGADGQCTFAYNMTQQAGTYVFQAAYEAP